MKAILTLDGEDYIIQTTTTKDVSFQLPLFQSEAFLLSPNSATLLASALLAAVHDIEENV